jgi:type II secretory pathway component GspD/PulD (secretin)
LNLLSSAATNAFSPNSLPSGSSYFANIGNSWDIAVQAAQADSHANIIQRPRIQTSQAQPAQFFVGSSVPYITGNYSYYGGGPQNSYSQLSVGVELDVTPFINPDGVVSMQIQQQIDEIDNPNYNNTAQPSTIKRTLNTTITVRDRDTVILGGFVKTKKSNSKSGVPFLMDIPLLGNLFTKRSDEKDRTELVVLMRPTVLKTPEIAAKNTIKETQRLPGVSDAAAENASDERKLIDAQSKREKADFKKTGQYDGFFNPLPDENAVPATNVPAADFGTAPQTSAGKPAPAAADEDKARAALDEKMKELDAPKATEPVSPTPQ